MGTAGDRTKGRSNEQARSRITNCTVGFGSGALLSRLRSAANAQVAGAADASAGDQSATDADGGEIVITAQKREEAILDIPQSVTVVGGDTLERSTRSTSRTI